MPARMTICASPSAWPNCRLLTYRETIFLEYFLRNAGRALSREMIAAALWPSESEIGSNVIDVYVRRLRAKLDAGGETPILLTVRGVGYRMDDR